VPRRTSKPEAPPVPTGRARAGRIPVLDAGLRLLARRAHSRVELRRKLARRGYEEDEIHGALRRLAELGYVDDAEFAAGHVRRRSASLGPLALSAELAARGVDRHTAGTAVKAFDRPSQVAAATRLAERLCARIRPAGYNQLLDSVGTRLLRRGFSPAVAREACRAVWAGTAGTPEP
jgi:regulatory protein